MAESSESVASPPSDVAERCATCGGLGRQHGGPTDGFTYAVEGARCWRCSQLANLSTRIDMLERKLNGSDDMPFRALVVRIGNYGRPTMNVAEHVDEMCTWVDAARALLLEEGFDAK